MSTKSYKVSESSLPQSFNPGLNVQVKDLTGSRVEDVRVEGLAPGRGPVGDGTASQVNSPVSLLYCNS